MTKVLEKLFEFCASLKLAIFLILALAFYLGSATVYEARYGTRAVQDIIYGSRPFVLLMALLSINVMAAVLVRYPWKRKQTGFIITHAGIEILLLGCLLSFRYSVDGKVSLQPGQKSEVIKLNDEEVGVDMADAGGKVRRHVFPVNLWKDAGYPSLAKFIGGSLHLTDLPEEARWPDGHTAVWPLGDGAKLEVLDWQPAAVPQVVLKPTPDGFPAAVVHLGGHLPNGMPMDQTINLLADGQGQGMVRPFGGTLELTLWKARSDAEVDEFLHPPKPEELPEMGRLAIHLDGKRYTLDVKKEELGKDAPLGDSRYKAAVEDYILHPPPPQLPENHGQAAMASEPVDPQVSLRLTGPNGVKKYLVAAWHPQFMAHLEESDVGHHGSASAGDPLVYYSHPQAYFTTKEGTRGRLQLLQALDGKLYARMFQLQRDPSQKPGEPFEVQVGREMQNFWLNISLDVVQHAPSAVLVNEFRPAHVEPRQMDDHPRAMKVALTVDGQRQETWLEREAGQVELTTPRGPVTIDYGFREYELGFAVGLNHAEQTNDPGTEQAATYMSDVSFDGLPKDNGNHVISMNEPATVNGLTFYQAGFQNVPDGQGGNVPFSTLSVRHDPGWIIKYLGCALIVGGIFTMFYMKAYFQKSVPVAVTAMPPGGTVVRPTPSKDKLAKGKPPVPRGGDSPAVKPA